MRWKLGNLQIINSMKKSLLFISAVSLLLAGCAKEQFVKEQRNDGAVTVVKATFEQLSNGATKAAVTDPGVFTWQNGDKAAFTESSSSTSYCFGTNNVAGATAQFAFDGSPTFTNSSLAIYPDDLTTDQVPTNLKVKVPDSRVWVNKQTNVAMYGKYETASSSFSFSHMGGLVRVRVKNVPTNAREFVFKASGCKINGEFTPESEGSYNVIKTTTSSTEGEQTYTLTWTTAPAAENTMDFYIPLPLGTYSGGFAFYLKDEGHNVLYSKVGSTSQTIARKKLLLMPAITLVGGSIEPVEKAAIVANIPAGYSGDYLLPQSEKVILKINASASDKDITLKYDGANIPTNLEVKVVDGDNAGNYNAKLLGNLPSTHVEFTQGHIDATELTTSSSTLAVINPATVGTLTVKGGNVLLKGATVTSIVVDNTAVASEETKAPVQIVMEKYTPTGGTEQTPAVTNKIEANADVVVAPVQGVTVKVEAPENVKVAKDGEGTVNDKNNQPITTQAAAKIGEAKYITLADAIAAVKDGETITMLGNVDKAAGISVPEGKNFTVDFSGFNYAMECPGAGSAATKTAGFQLLKNSTIVFKNGTLKCTDANKDKTWSSGDASKGIAIMIQNYADLTLEDITIDAANIAHNNASVRYALSNNCGNVEYKGTTTIQTTGNDYAFDVCKYMDYSAPTVTWNSTGTVNGGIELSGGKFVVAKNLSVSVPVMAAEGESTLEIGTGATLSAASDFNDPNPNLSNHKSTAPVQVKQGAGLTISGAGTVEGINNVYSAVVVSINGDDDTKAAKLTVTGNVTLKGNYYGVVGNGQRHNTEITVNGGTIKGTYTNDNLGIYHPQAGKLTITGGTIEGYSSAVEVRGGTVNISGGSLTATATTFSCTKNGSGNTTVGAALAIAQHNTRKPISVTIDGGTFTGYKAISVEDPEDGDPQNVNVVINGGTFSDLSGVEYVADNATYTLGADVDNAKGMIIDTKKTFTVDFGGHTYTVNKPGAGSINTQTSAFQLLKDQTITFKNGTIRCHENNKSLTWETGKSDVEKGIAMIIQDYAKLTLEKMTIDGTNIAHNGNNVRYMVSSNYGDINFTGNTSIIAPAGDFAFDAYDNTSDSYPNVPTVTWNSTGSVTGNIELAGGKLVIASNLGYANTIMATEGTSNLEVNATLSATDASDWYLVKAGSNGKSGVVLNISGTGTLSSGTSVHCIPVTSDYGAQVNISGGDYKCYGDGECVYANRDGKVSISGGTFGVREGDTVKDLLNVQNDQDVTDIQCTGGTFHGKNPADGDDAKGSTFVAPGYVSTETTEGSKVWTVSAEQN